eukprot:8913839-Pyramimonas_sp.AAC.1
MSREESSMPLVQELFLSASGATRLRQSTETNGACAASAHVFTSHNRSQRHNHSQNGRTQKNHTLS